MNPLTTFTVHAFDRVIERIHLSHEEVASILDSGETLDLGLEPKSRRMHRLFYSVTDGQCFVAVQDQKTKEVVTILPASFDRKCKIADSTLHDFTIRSQKKAEGENDNKESVAPIAVPRIAIKTEEKVKKSNKKSKVSASKDSGPKHNFLCCFWHKKKREPRTRILKVDVLQYAGDKDELEANPAIYILIRDFVAAHILDGETLEKIYLRRGSNRAALETFSLKQEAISQ